MFKMVYGFIYLLLTSMFLRNPFVLLNYGHLDLVHPILIYIFLISLSVILTFDHSVSYIYTYGGRKALHL